jgi:hypothetical protein
MQTAAISNRACMGTDVDVHAGAIMAMVVLLNLE